MGQGVDAETQNLVVHMHTNHLYLHETSEHLDTHVEDSQLLQDICFCNSAEIRGVIQLWMT